MKRTTLIAAVMLALTAIAHANPITMSLQIRKGDVRSSPSFLGKIVGSAAYGDRLTVEETKGAWSRVTADTSDLTGWLHSSALTKKKVKLTAGEKDADVAASSGELALAGKGFNSEVEAEFKAKNKDIDFTWIEKMEKLKVSRKELQDFVKKGEVVAPKGGAK